MSDDPTAISIKDLVGLRVLRGIARDVVAGEWGETRTRVVLHLDDFIVEFLEDHNDGYRSSLDEVRRWQSVSRYLAEHDEVSLAPIYPPLVVMIRHRGESEYEYGDAADAIYAIDERTGLVVLDIGTDNINDYYPSFVFQWTPEGWTPRWLNRETDKS